MQVILGSQSPRRKEILSFFSIPFKQVSSSFDEEAVPFEGGDPQAYANVLSKGKADALFSQFPHDVILTADTLVYREGKIYGKPRDEQQAFDYLKALKGQWHSVYTSLTIRYREQEHQRVEETRVLFNELTDEQIHTYYRTLPYADKAGGYMIQGAGCLVVKKIEGCYYNVMGLPTNALYQVLNSVGIDLWNYLK